jgi:hypothetical protein
VVETVISSSQSLTSSIGIGEFSMNPAPRGSAVVFVPVKDHLFSKLKFLKGTKEAPLDLSMDATSICGYFLRVCCGVLYLKPILTSINMIKQQFNGKLH